jgi:hypothetical protein
MPDRRTERGSAASRRENPSRSGGGLRVALFVLAPDNSADSCGFLTATYGGIIGLLFPKEPVPTCAPHLHSPARSGPSLPTLRAETERPQPRGSKSLAGAFAGSNRHEIDPVGIVGRLPGRTWARADRFNGLVWAVRIWIRCPRPTPEGSERPSYRSRLCLTLPPAPGGQESDWRQGPAASTASVASLALFVRMNVIRLGHSVCFG